MTADLIAMLGTADEDEFLHVALKWARQRYPTTPDDELIDWVAHVIRSDEALLELFATRATALALIKTRKTGELARCL